MVEPSVQGCPSGSSIEVMAFLREARSAPRGNIIGRGHAARAAVVADDVLDVGECPLRGRLVPAAAAVVDAGDA